MPRHRLQSSLWMPRGAHRHRGAGNLRRPVSGYAVLWTSVDHSADSGRISLCSRVSGWAVSHQLQEPGSCVLPGAGRKSVSGRRDGSNSGTVCKVHFEFLETPATNQRVSEKSRPGTEFGPQGTCVHSAVGRSWGIARTEGSRPSCRPATPAGAVNGPADRTFAYGFRTSRRRTNSYAESTVPPRGRLLSESARCARHGGTAGRNLHIH